MAPAKKKLSRGTQPAGGDKPSDVAETTSKNPDQSQEGGDENDVASNPSHKRTFSKTDDSDQHVAEGSSVPPSNKKAKSDAPDTLSAPDSENELESSWSDIDEKDLLVPMTPNGPNIFYGCADALFDLFKTGNSDESALWPKPKVMDAYRSLPDDEDYDSSAEDDDDESEREDFDIPCLSILCDPKDLETPEAKLLQSQFEADSDRSWYEVTLTRHLPADAPKKLRVDLEAGYYGMRTGVVGEQSLGKWWITDISVAKGESEEAITTILEKMF
ncbi:uncharacterized protein LACBIDRAFT_295420 [Laccaria bicolor S238N-H82]|uniref:Predicted protein n=1 Tax=Laccaria bicolor (strain S238N-H82 / ATCC MYA-4686) TaxID=486041 RepID=B0DSE2_LACBS|nr:uncharacterized protein LACBIDRAFT_295420 [Laccaria bicolor S238N-H82]EDR02460.1 predicted protein [Laccaria bicolor S238N-H82]|eukprot:XP_001886823.1 predicted protein [Laccaria bicolor S238N-H82]